MGLTRENKDVFFLRARAGPGRARVVEEGAGGGFWKNSSILYRRGGGHVLSHSCKGEPDHT